MLTHSAVRQDNLSGNEIVHGRPFRSLCPLCAASLETLYRDEHEQVKAWLAQHVGGERADDLAQEVFIGAARSPQLPRLKNPSAFLYRIARNLLIDKFRRQGCTPRTISLCDAPETASEPDQEAAFTARETRMIYEDTLAQFPEKTARIFRLSRQEHRTYRQIGEMLGISEAAVEYHMMRALARLRETLGDAICAE